MFVLLDNQLGDKLLLKLNSITVAIGIVYAGAVALSHGQACTELWNNGPIITHPGEGAGGADVSSVSPGFDFFGFRTDEFRQRAENFEVPDDTWAISRITTFVYQVESGLQSTITGFFFRIWDGKPGDGGKVIWGDMETNLLSSTEWSGIYRTGTSASSYGNTSRPIMEVVAADLDIHLPQGHYWLEWWCIGSFDYSGPFVPAVSGPTSPIVGNSIYNFFYIGWEQGFEREVLGYELPFIIEGRAQRVDSCRADVDGNGFVNAGDLGAILAGWDSTCNPVDLNTDNFVNAADVAEVLSSWGQVCSPQILDVFPNTSGTDGGELIKISGRHLAGVTSVAIGGVGVEIASITSNQLQVISPPGPQGLADLLIETVVGSVLLEDAVTIGLEWAEVIRTRPDPQVVVDQLLRESIESTNLPWHVRDKLTKVELLLIPNGSFVMGCSPSNQWECYDDEYPIRVVEISSAFYLARYEMTQSLWMEAMWFNPSDTIGSSNPVDRITWANIQAFEAITGFRLPTEAEWEFACRAGTNSAFNNGSDSDSEMLALAWTSANSSYDTQAVGQKFPNRLGLFDMHGNVAEWCEDWYDPEYYKVAPSIDPDGPRSGSARVLRGGHFAGPALFCRSSHRSSDDPSAISNRYGFRPARSP